MKKSKDARKRPKLSLTSDTIARLTSLATADLVDVQGGMPQSRIDPGGCSAGFPCSAGC